MTGSKPSPARARVRPPSATEDQSQTGPTWDAFLYRSPTPPSVDTAASAAHLPPVSKKPHKVAEPQAPYPAKKPAKAAAGVKYADPAKVKETNAKLMQVHRVVLQKLAR